MRRIPLPRPGPARGRRFRSSAAFTLTPLVLALAGCGSTPPAADAPSPPPEVPASPVVAEPEDLVLTLVDQSPPTTALVQAVSVPAPGVVWASGHEGRWLRSVDGGARWFVGRGPGGDSLQFRDVDAVDDSTAWLMSAGSGSASRIYRTDDAGASWRLQYLADDPAAFLDCMAFWDRTTGVAYGDAVDGTLFVLRTVDGGESWERLGGDAVSPAQPDEGGFAASGSCAAAGPEGRGWIATGNAERARILVTDDGGASWRVVEPPVVGGAGGGLTAVSVPDGRRGVAVGGVLQDTDRGRHVAVTDDGGLSWRPGGTLALAGAAYGAAVAPGLPGPTVVAVGPGGLDWSIDGGLTWRHVDDRTFWAVGFGPGGVGWATGPDGRIVRIEIGPQAASERSPDSR